MRSLYRRLGITVAPGEEWKLLLPWLTIAATAMLVVFAGVATGVSAALYAPMAFFIAVCFAGIPIAYLAGAQARDDEDPPPAP